MGMETGLSTLLLLLGILYALKYVKEPTSPRVIITAVCLGLAFLTRNDSAIFAALIFGYALSATYKPTPGGAIVRHVLVVAILYGSFVVGQAIFQQVYYVLPNTYVLKLTGMPLSARIRDGIGFVRPFLVETMVVLIAVITDLTFNFSKTKLFLVSFLFVAIEYQVWVGSDQWNYWRIMSPAMPLVFVLFVQAVVMIIRILSDTIIYRDYVLRNLVLPRQWAIPVLVISLTFVGLVIVNSRFLGEFSLLYKPYTAMANQENVNTAIAVNQVTNRWC